MRGIVLRHPLASDGGGARPLWQLLELHVRRRALLVQQGVRVQVQPRPLAARRVPRLRAEAASSGY